ncbi:response regulator transcription factor [Crocinitomicaceae bacterium]|jgi:two-component system alkaline phosphatase synthesis response regulator PhoP|nr:response regulator transcription factor [Crocinitomicaceae bacterium]MDA9169511.1 response regulator transcription factor [Crocinitomicaceae bacterium]MDG1037260.1 response regulator transcription factor [Crocinitomicaceae bacterium]
MTLKASNYTILLVDDEQDILEFLSYSLKKEGYKIFTANNGKEGVELSKSLRPDLILLDVMMPQIDGIEACQMIRKDLHLEQPIIAFLTSRSEDYSQIAGLEAGADDYITKPIRPRLLTSKVESLLRRKKESKVALDNKELKIDREKYLIAYKGNEMLLPKKEFELLELLASKPGKVFNRDQILSLVWGDGAIVGERTIDVHVRKLREKLGNNYIRTIKGVGYTFNEF